MAEIEIEVDGLAVPVDADEYDADPDAVIATVRRNRQIVRVDDGEPDPDEADAVLRGER